MQHPRIGRSAFCVAVLVASLTASAQEAEREDALEPIDSVTIIGRRGFTFRKKRASDCAPISVFAVLVSIAVPALRCWKTASSLPRRRTRHPPLTTSRLNVVCTRLKYLRVRPLSSLGRVQQAVR
jgi:hypothetical protein